MEQSPTLESARFLIYMRENQQMHQLLLLFNLLVMYGGSYTFRHYIAIIRERS
jgi:hypothetical protein